jgi:hypothetical protein
VNDGPQTVRAIWVVRDRRGADAANEAGEIASGERRLQRVVDGNTRRPARKRRA